MKKRCLNYTVVKSLITFLLLVHFLSASTFVKAKVQLPSILSSNMVLQQHTNVKLWVHNYKLKYLTKFDKFIYYNDGIY